MACWGASGLSLRRVPEPALWDTARRRGGSPARFRLNQRRAALVRSIHITLRWSRQGLHAIFGAGVNQERERVCGHSKRDPGLDWATSWHGLVAHAAAAGQRTAWYGGGQLWKWHAVLVVAVEVPRAHGRVAKVWTAGDLVGNQCRRRVTTIGRDDVRNNRTSERRRSGR